MAEIMGYTRTVCENECYEAKLAYSMHLAIKTEKESFTPFNHNLQKQRKIRTVP